VKTASKRHGGTADDGAETNYTRRQRSNDADYQREYHAWVASLPPEERRQLAELGLDNPQMPDTSGSGFCDAADVSKCSIQPEVLDEPDEEVEPVPRHGAQDKEDLLHFVRRLVGELLGQDNIRLSVECLAVATGMSYLGDSMTEIARRHNVTRAAVSKRCVEFTDSLGLAPSRAMRSSKARQSYRRRRITQLNQQNLVP
jgi:hypothetical protein